MQRISFSKAAIPVMLTAMIVFLFLESCKKNGQATNNNKLAASEELSGGWRLTQYLFDPGDGSGQWTAPTQQQASSIAFGSENTFSYSGPLVPSSYKNEYLAKNDSVVIFINGTDSAFCRYKVTGDDLTINMQCIEACGLRYVRIKAD